MKNLYNSLDDWKPDYDKMVKSPKDRDLVAAIQNRVNNSPKEIQDEITEYLESVTLDQNPWWTLKRIAQRNPGFYLIVKSNEQPFFEI